MKSKIKKIFKYILISLSIVSTIGLIIIAVTLLFIFGVIQEYKYIKVDKSNKEEIVLLLKGQKYNMFNKSKNFDVDKCIESVSKIEMEVLFPDGERYQIYCNNKRYEFSLDNTDFDLPNYISNNGKKRYRLSIK